MSTVIVDKKYTDILAPLGDVQQAIDEALRHYTVEKIGRRIADLHREIRHWEEIYQCPFEVFYAHVTADEDYVSSLRAEHPTWERDFQQWEFYTEELREWIAHLESILTT